MKRINLKLALLLKSKGINIQATHGYGRRPNINKNEWFLCQNNDRGTPGKWTGKDSVSAPLLIEVVEYFRKRKGITIFVVTKSIAETHGFPDFKDIKGKFVSFYKINNIVSYFVARDYNSAIIKAILDILQ